MAESDDEYQIESDDKQINKHQSSACPGCGTHYKVADSHFHKSAGLYEKADDDEIDFWTPKRFKDDPIFQPLTVEFAEAFKFAESYGGANYDTALHHIKSVNRENETLTLIDDNLSYPIANFGFVKPDLILMGITGIQWKPTEFWPGNRVILFLNKVPHGAVVDEASETTLKILTNCGCVKCVSGAFVEHGGCSDLVDFFGEGVVRHPGVGRCAVGVQVKIVFDDGELVSERAHLIV